VREDQEVGAVQAEADHRLKTGTREAAGQAARHEATHATAIPEQGRWRASALRGHYQYYAVPDNSAALNAFRKRLIRHWLWSLRRRSQRGTMTWERMWRLADRWLPQPRILPWPEQRFAAITQGRSPVR
jgi:RNA-directed DNA polymerase